MLVHPISGVDPDNSLPLAVAYQDEGLEPRTASLDYWVTDTAYDCL